MKGKIWVEWVGTVAACNGHELGHGKRRADVSLETGVQ